MQDRTERYIEKFIREEKDRNSGGIGKHRPHTSEFTDTAKRISIRNNGVSER